MTRAGGGCVVLVTCEYPPFPGGIATFCGQVADALVQRGHRVVAIAPAYPELPPATARGVEVHRIFGHHRIGPVAVARLLAILASLPRDAVLIGADIRTIILLHLLKPLHRRAYRAMVHGSEASKFRAGSLPFLIARRAYLKAALVAYNSNATRQIFHAGLGRPAREVISYLGVDPVWFDTVDGPFDHPELADVAPGALLFCSVGRVEARKGQLQTIRALALARTRYGMPDPVYVIAGRVEDERYAAELATEAASLSVRTIFTGRIADEDLRRLYRRARANLLFAQELPGKIEGFGLVLIEAAAQQCPSIATDIGGIPEVVGDAGILVPAGDQDAFARAIATLGQFDTTRASLAEAARLRAQKFTWQACASHLMMEVSAPLQASQTPAGAVL